MAAAISGAAAGVGGGRVVRAERLSGVEGPEGEGRRGGGRCQGGWNMHWCDKSLNIIPCAPRVLRVA